MEALLNYTYWQTLAINEFDSVSHVLRTENTLVTSPPCSDIQVGPNVPPACRSYLGPFQPGINGQSDPTVHGPLIKPTLPKKAGETRVAGQPRALALPGQPDISIPQVTLPPDVQALLDKLKQHLPKGKHITLSQLRNLPNLQDIPGAPAPDQMLDFLLSP